MSDIEAQIIATTKEVLNRAGFDGEVKINSGTVNAAMPVVTIESEDDLGILIGKNGQNLTALEHILRLIMIKRNQNNKAMINFVLDINNYRQAKSGYITEQAHSAAQRVISTQKAEALAPMTAYERRLVHTELASYKEVQTESIGEEPRRRIVIKPLLLE